MKPQYSSEEEYQILCLEKALNLYSQYITSAGQELKIPPDEIGPRFLGAVENDEEWVVFKAHFGERVSDGSMVQVRMGDVQFFFERFEENKKSNERK